MKKLHDKRLDSRRPEDILVSYNAIFGPSLWSTIISVNPSVRLRTSFRTILIPAKGKEVYISVHPIVSQLVKITINWPEVKWPFLHRGVLTLFIK